MLKIHVTDLQGTILHSRVLVLPNVFENLKTSCTKHLTESETTALFSAYNLPASTPEQERRSLNELISDLRFYVPTLAAHGGWKAAFTAERSFRYHFHVPNPVKGEFTDLASHELDVALLLQNFSEQLDEATNKTSTEMTDQWIKFVSGEPWSEPGKVVIIGARGVAQVDEEEYDRDFREGNGKVLLALGFDKCFRVVEGWQGIRVEAK
jgi:carboxylesterase type B